MKVISFILPILLFFVWGGAPVYATTGTSTIYVQIEDVPREIKDQTIRVLVGTGPNEPPAADIILSKLNNFSTFVEVDAGATYYCSAAVQYDYAGDYALTEISGLSAVDAVAGKSYTFIYTVSSGYYESIMGKARYGDVTVEPVPGGYDVTQTAQIGCYLTAPAGFDHHTIVYLANCYTGERYILNLYASNLLAAIEPEATAGKYQYLGARVAGDDAGRYTFSSDADTLITEEGATFHLTVRDTDNLERALTTPSRADVGVQTATPAVTPEPTVQPSPTPQKEKIGDTVSYLSLLFDALLILALLLTVYICAHKNRR